MCVYTYFGSIFDSKNEPKKHQWAPKATPGRPRGFPGDTPDDPKGTNGSLWGAHGEPKGCHWGPTWTCRSCLVHFASKMNQKWCHKGAKIDQNGRLMLRFCIIGDLSSLGGGRHSHVKLSWGVVARDRCPRHPFAPLFHIFRSNMFLF